MTNTTDSMEQQPDAAHPGERHPDSPTIAKVIVNLSLDRVFDYRIPAGLRSEIRIGTPVRVPFQHGFRDGYVLDLATTSEHPELKEIFGILGNMPRIPQPLIGLAQWMADYYCCTREQAVRCLLPGPVRGGKLQEKTETIYSLADIEKAHAFLLSPSKTLEAQREIVKALLVQHYMTGHQIRNEIGCSVSPIEQLEKKGLILREKRTVFRDPLGDALILPTSPLPPTPDQAAAIAAIGEMLDHPERRPNALLLHGVTGSGKTEVYLQSIAHALSMRKETIVLVPEISLTPQTVEWFRARFGDKVSVLHSGLGDRERFDQWRKIYREEVQIVVGARSALFAPFRNLGLIIVDEEHEQTYKQDSLPRYHARDVAVVRGHRENAAVVLGSATPSFESYANALSGKYRLARMPRRVLELPLPPTRIVDIRSETARTGRPSVLSEQLVEEIRIRLERGEQTILFLNRRGYARQMQCPLCGYVAECGACSVSFTYHRERECLVCHLCGEVRKAPESCPQCASKEIRFHGYGTERIEAIAKSIFKGVSIARMDSDTMTRRDSYQKVLTDFKRGDIDILIGTQMVAKGLHFPKVSLVGVVNADSSLNIPDFRSVERTFQLLTQVSGRTGRSEIPGLVLIQTLSPYNPAVQHASNHDFEAFYEEEIEIRQQLGYPPGNHLHAVHVNGENESDVAGFAQTVMDEIRPFLKKGILASEPAPAPVAKIRNRHRFVITLRGPNTAALRKKLRKIALEQKIPAGIELYVDVDAINLM